MFEEATPTPFYLTTERLLLRRFTERDVVLLVELDSDPDVMRYVSGGAATPRDEIEDEILPAFLRYYDRSDGYGFWAAIEKDTGAFIGWFHLRPNPDEAGEDPELGYRLRSSAWGMGYATEGSRALVDKAFRELGAKRVVAGTMAINAASRRVIEKAGLTFVRLSYPAWLLSIDGGADGAVEYELNRTDWEIDSAVSGAGMQGSV